jgi:hypothetical protein
MSLSPWLGSMIQYPGVFGFFRRPFVQSPWTGQSSWRVQRISSLWPVRWSERVLRPQQRKLEESMNPARQMPHFRYYPGPKRPE